MRSFTKQNSTMRWRTDNEYIACAVFWFVDVVARKLGRLLEELTDDDCTIILCGFFCQPCLIAQALEEVDENWWVTCCTVMFAPNLLGIPYMCFTAPVCQSSLRLQNQETDLVSNLGNEQTQRATWR